MEAFVFFLKKKKTLKEREENRWKKETFKQTLSLIPSVCFLSLSFLARKRGEKPEEREEAKGKHYLSKQKQKRKNKAYLLISGFFICGWKDLELLLFFCWIWSEEDDGSKQFRSMAKRCFLFGCRGGSGICWCVRFAFLFNSCFTFCMQFGTRIWQLGLFDFSIFMGFRYDLGVTEFSWIGFCMLHTDVYDMFCLWGFQDVYLLLCFKRFV